MFRVVFVVGDDSAVTLLFMIIIIIIGYQVYIGKTGMNAISKNNHIYVGDQEQEQVDQFIEEYPQTSQYNITNKVNRNIKQQEHNTIDKILIILAVLSVMCAMIVHFYVGYMLNRVSEQELNGYKQWEVQSQMLTDKFFKRQQQDMLKLKKNKKMQTGMILKQQKQVQNKVKQLKKNKCPQLLNLPAYLQQYQIINPYEHQNLQPVPQPQHQQINQLNSQLSQLNKKQAQQQSYMKTLNKPISKQAAVFQPVGGITFEKVQLAKKLRAFTKMQPWQCNQLCIDEYEHYQKYSRISEYEELPFCIVVPTFNNQHQDRYKHNLNSITQQNYTNYHIVIMQDASTDNTPQLLNTHAAYLIQQWHKYNKTIKIDIHHNKQQQRAMPNLRKAAMQYCKPEEIYMIVDGDDQLVGKQVFKLFNAQFQEKKSWFVYSNFISFVGTVGFSRPFKRQVVQENRYRTSNFVTSHLRAFYTQLFRLIKEEDLKNDNGEYLRAANDVAICLPILQMAHYRVAYIPEITYMYNSNTGLNNHLVRIGEQIENSKLIRKRQKYAALPQLKFDQLQNI